MRRISPLILLAILFALGAQDAAAQELSVDLGGDGQLSSRVIQLFVLITVLSLAPGLAMMLTCFPFMVTVLSLLRQAIGLQQAPPNMLIVSLAIFLTYFVMAPVFEDSWRNGVRPYLDGNVTEEQAFTRSMTPFRDFMERRVAPQTLEAMTAVAPARDNAGEGDETALSILIPSFLLSEIQRGFEIGFLVFLPFLIIDLVIASVLMSMGMMMVPPTVVALPFKLAFFVVADGWTLIAGALVRGYAQ